MSAPKNNQFWKMRSQHGREKIFTDPKVLLQAAYEYFDWNSRNPWVKNEAIKSGDRAGHIIQIPTERPMTIKGLTQYIGVNERYFDDFEKGLINPKDDEFKKVVEDFSAVITHVREVISRQKFEGAAVGAFVATIVSQELGLVNKVEAKNTNLNYNSDVVVTGDEAIAIKNAILKDI